jgi:ssDNA-specific exonuclease RecJ
VESTAGLEADVYGLFGEEDFNACREYMESLAPGRDRLADFYTYLTRARASQLVDPEQAAAYMRARGLARAGIHTIAFGLSVFSDLGLLTHRPENGGYRFFPVKVEKKRDIEQSAVFRRGQQIKTASLSWLDSLRLAAR